MLDFRLETYQILLKSLSMRDFSFQTLTEFLVNPVNKIIILRHDVDLNPTNSLATAMIESDLSIKGSYFFRIGPVSYDPGIIHEIASMGHEIGYHYEDVSMAAERLRSQSVVQRAWGKGQGAGSEENLVKMAIISFTDNLEKLRSIVPVRTICMHGSPMSRWDSRLLWKYYDYKEFGIIGEPYFDVDFDEVLYLTDTGRRWDGEKVSVRDKAQSSVRRAQGAVQGENPYSDWKVKPVKYRFTESSTQYSAPNPQPPAPRFHSTFDIIKVANQDLLPQKIMMTFHAQRWTDEPIPWLKELVWQNIKNVGKYFLMRIRD